MREEEEISLTPEFYYTHTAIFRERKGEREREKALTSMVFNGKICN